MMEKIELGQFYTRTSPFKLDRFQKWVDSIPDFKNLKFIEPFAGSNSIIQMISQDLSVSFSQWEAFDIDPAAQEQNLVPLVELIARDTIAAFPMGFDVAITNPPYLAKNSATRKGLRPLFNGYQDLYEVALEKMLAGCNWVAAIIPESFITRNVHRSRLEFVISLNLDMFHDTEFPVCLAVFSPIPSETHEIWRGNEFLGTEKSLAELSKKFLNPFPKHRFKFNDPAGVLGLWAIDNTKCNSIRFLRGEMIESATIKVSSRAITRISHESINSDELLDAVISKANSLLEGYRDATQDVFMTSFKGLRSDGRYRRRIDWATASKILDKAMEDLGLLGVPNTPSLF